MTERNLTALQTVQNDIKSYLDPVLLISDWQIMKLIRQDLESNEWSLPLLWTCCIFICLYALLILTVSAHDRRRISTLFIGSVVLFTYWAIIFSSIDPHWLVGRTRLISSYCTITPNVFTEADLRVNIGLSSLNITYVGNIIKEKTLTNEHNRSPTIKFNEQFDLSMGYVPYHYDDPGQTMKMIALKRGLPNPILTITELLSRNEGYGYGRLLKWNGELIHLFLMSTLILSVIGNVLIISVPRYGYRVFIGIGCLLITSCILHAITNPMFINDKIRVEGKPLIFDFGRSFYIVAAAGIINLLTGVIIPMITFMGYCDTVSTFFELDYDCSWSIKEMEQCMKNKRLHCSTKDVTNTTYSNHGTYASYPEFATEKTSEFNNLYQYQSKATPSTHNRSIENSKIHQQIGDHSTPKGSFVRERSKSLSSQFRENKGAATNHKNEALLIESNLMAPPNLTRRFSAESIITPGQTYSNQDMGNRKKHNMTKDGDFQNFKKPYPVSIKSKRYESEKCDFNTVKRSKTKSESLCNKTLEHYTATSNLLIDHRREKNNF